LIATILVTGHTWAQPMPAMVFGVPDQQVLEGHVVQVVGATITTEAGMSEQVAGGAVGAGLCGLLLRHASWQASAAGSIACGAVGQMAGKAVGTTTRPAADVIVHTADGRMVSVREVGTPNLLPGDKVYLVRSGAVSRVVRAQ
jgi:outer membrane lipoprotein SlyB